MNWIFLVSGGLFLVLAGLVGVDYLSTSIVTDGSFVLASSGQRRTDRMPPVSWLRMHLKLRGP